MNLDFILLILFLSFCCLCDGASNLHVMITDKGVSRLAADLQHWVSTRVGNPGMLRDLEQAKLNLKIENIQVTHFQIGRIALRFSEDGTATLDFDNIRLQVSNDWSYKAGFLRDSGTIQTDIRGAELSLWDIRPVALPPGLPYIHPELNCGVQVGTVDARFRGKHSAIYNLLKTVFIGAIKKQTENALCAESTFLLEKYLADRAQKLNLRVDLGDDIFVDYGLERKPALAQNGLRTEHFGQVFSDIPDWSVRHFSAARRPDLGDLPPDKMVHFVLEDSLFLDLMEQLFANELLVLYLSEETLEDGLKHLLKLSCSQRQYCLGKMSPELQSRYPPGSRFEVLLQVREAPQFSLDSAEVQLNLTSSLHFHLRLPPTMQAEYLFSTTVLLSYRLDLRITPTGKIQATAHRKRMAATEMRGERIPISDVHTAIRHIYDQIVEPKLAQALDTGLPLPHTEAMELREISLNQRNRHLVISANSN